MTAPPLATPFHTLLVATRGEIALRVMRSARALGLRTVAVHSTADAGSRHVREADRAVCIGEPLPAQSYLNIPAILDAARCAGADAVHPGYGFLAENEDFAQACQDAGLVFVGPSAASIRAMGDKAGAKVLMQQAGVPCIPGYQGEDQTEERLAAEAARIGYPVMIKATAGGGGRGMRRVDAAADFAGLLRSARSEALGAFGDATVLLERAIEAPRHFEIQVLADRHGHAIHLGERDCSVQRRHQKLIEEAPSPAVSPALRARMGEAALAAVRAIGYEGVGTLEFLLDAEGRFYFMEMNTRLQVEHPVTEAITGLDLVALQLRVAAGEPLPLAQDEVRFDGHAIEVRLCAEDAGAGFMPQSGVLSRWRMPDSLRVEHALEDGAAVPPFYDSMIAKLVAHGRTRDEARRRLLAGLASAEALGVATNQAFLQRCLAHPVFAEGGATTAFIAQHQDALLAPDEAGQGLALAAAALLRALGRAPGAALAAPHPLAHRLPTRLHLALDGQAHVLQLVPGETGHYTVRAGEREHRMALIDIAPGRLRFVCDGVEEEAGYQAADGRLWLHCRGQAWCIEDRTLAPAVRAAGSDGDGRLRAAMNGRVVAVLAEPGQTVKAGQPLLTLEAMKMEHVHAAPAAGVLAAVHVAVGDQVAAGRLMAEIQPAAPAAPAR